MNLAQLAQQVAEKCGYPDAATLLKVKRWIATRYQLVWSQANWRDAITVYPRAVAAGTTHVVLDDEAEAVLIGAWDRRGLFPADEALQLNQRVAQLLDEGDPCELADVGRVGLHGDPQDGALTLVSSSADDTTPVTIVGVDAATGREERDVYDLAGTTPVSTADTRPYSLVRALSKLVTVGTVTVARASDSAVLGTLRPADVERQYVRLRLMPAAQQAGTLLVAAKRRCHPVLGDSDVFVVRGAVAAVEAFARGDLLQFARQYGKAQAAFDEALALYKAAANSDTWTPARLPRAIPVDGVGDCRAW